MSVPKTSQASACSQSGAELLQPLAIAVIGGLAVALLLSLVVTPTVYAMLGRETKPARG